MPLPRRRLPGNGGAGLDLDVSIETYSRLTRDAGLDGLTAEIRTLSSAQLADDLSLLIELPAPLLVLAMPRVRLSIWELRDRLIAGQERAA